MNIEGLARIVDADIKSASERSRIYDSQTVDLSKGLTYNTENSDRFKALKEMLNEQFKDKEEKNVKFVSNSVPVTVEYWSDMDKFIIHIDGKSLKVDTLDKVADKIKSVAKISDSRVEDDVEWKIESELPDVAKDLKLVLAKDENGEYYVSVETKNRYIDGVVIKGDLTIDTNEGELADALKEVNRNSLEFKSEEDIKSAFKKLSRKFRKDEEFAEYFKSFVEDSECKEDPAGIDDVSIHMSDHYQMPMPKDVVKVKDNVSVDARYVSGGDGEYQWLEVKSVGDKEIEFLASDGETHSWSKRDFNDKIDEGEYVFDKIIDSMSADGKVRKQSQNSKQIDSVQTLEEDVFKTKLMEDAQSLDLRNDGFDVSYSKDELGGPVDYKISVDDVKKTAVGNVGSLKFNNTYKSYDELRAMFKVLDDYYKHTLSTGKDLNDVEGQVKDGIDEDTDSLIKDIAAGFQIGELGVIEEGPGFFELSHYKEDGYPFFNLSFLDNGEYELSVNSKIEEQGKYKTAKDIFEIIKTAETIVGDAEPNYKYSPIEDAANELYKEGKHVSFKSPETGEILEGEYDGWFGGSLHVVKKGNKYFKVKAEDITPIRKKPQYDFTERIRNAEREIQEHNDYISDLRNDMENDDRVISNPEGREAQEYAKNISKHEDRIIVLEERIKSYKDKQKLKDDSTDEDSETYGDNLLSKESTSKGTLVLLSKPNGYEINLHEGGELTDSVQLTERGNSIFISSEGDGTIMNAFKESNGGSSMVSEYGGLISVFEKMASAL